MTSQFCLCFKEMIWSRTGQLIIQQPLFLEETLSPLVARRRQLRCGGRRSFFSRQKLFIQCVTIVTTSSLFQLEERKKETWGDRTIYLFLASPFSFFRGYLTTVSCVTLIFLCVTVLTTSLKPLKVIRREFLFWFACWENVSCFTLFGCGFTFH